MIVITRKVEGLKGWSVEAGLASPRSKAQSPMSGNGAQGSAFVRLRRDKERGRRGFWGNPAAVARMCSLMCGYMRINRKKVAQMPSGSTHKICNVIFAGRCTKVTKVTIIPLIPIYLLSRIQRLAFLSRICYVLQPFSISEWHLTKRNGTLDNHD